MNGQTIIIKKSILQNTAGIVVFDLEKYQAIEKELEGYRKKVKTLKSLSSFENLANWGKEFARKQGITYKQVLKND